MWKFFNPFGQEKQLNVSAALATLPTVENALAADVQLTNANQYYDGPSVVLTPGTWFLSGAVDLAAPIEPGTSIFTAKLWDGTTVFASGEGNSVTSGASPTRIPLSAVITVGATTTVKISVASDRSYASGNNRILAASLVNAAGNNASKLTAIMLSPPTAMPFYAGAANYVTLAQFAALVPTDGMTVNVVVDAAAGVIWTFRYNAGSASAYKWEFLGGPPLMSEVTTIENIVPSAYSALTTPGPNIVLPRAGDYIVEQSGNFRMVTIGVNYDVYMSYDIGATGAVDADAIFWRTPSAGNDSAWQLSRTRPKTGLGAVTLTSKYRNSNNANPQSVGARMMRVIPVRVS